VIGKSQRGGYDRGMTVEMLTELAKYQAWADREHWRVLHGNAQLMEDAEIRKRLNHMLFAFEFLQALARGERRDPASMKERESMSEIETAMEQETESILKAIGSSDLGKQIPLPRGPKGPFEATTGALLLQALLHNQHHRGQNASRMRQLGVTPPITDYIVWYGLGRP